MQNSEDPSGRAEPYGVRNIAKGERQKAEGRRQKAKGKRQKAKGKRQKAKAKGRRQKAKGRRQKAKGRRQKAELEVFPNQGSSDLPCSNLTATGDKNTGCVVLSAIITVLT
ncbi:MAG: hypothetical protein AAGD09_04085 [Cyanobacteria bacterium P01_F01_bin.56]